MDFRHVIGHEDLITHFRSMIETDHVGHAYILGGESGSGRSTLAYCFAKALLCENSGTDGCGECKSCHQADSGNHPDLIYVTHEKPGTISVNDIRTQVVNTMEISPYEGKYKIYIIKDGEKMNIQAENALLKTIEEPPEYGIIIIVTNNPDKLLHTIRSRCQIFMTKPVKEKEIREYLHKNYDVSDSKIEFAVEYSQGNLGKAILLASNEEYDTLVQSVVELESDIFNMDMDDIVRAIKKAKEFNMDIGEYLDLMMMWYRDIVVYKVTGNPDKIMFKNEFLTIKDQAKFLSFNELEDKSRAIENAKKRINANADMSDIMKLLILTLKEK